MQLPSAPLKRIRILPALLVFSTLMAGVFIGTLISRSVDAAPEADEPVSDATPLTVPPADPVENQFSEIARNARPSVVSIFIPAAREQEPEAGDREFSTPEDMFRRFFGMPPGTTPPKRRGPGQGSGVIVDPKGYIITNNHVVENAERIQVTFVDDDEEYDAKLIGVDPETDLAVLHVEGKDGLKAARIGNSDAANVGDWAIAVGSPFGYRETVTVGIISAKSREVGSAERSRPFQKFLQTDAAINPGNSGGPLLNIRGELIGINTAIISRTGGYDGIGFALASNIAVETYNQIIRHGRVSRGSIGVQFSSEQSPSLSRSYGAKGGVFVMKVISGGPAEEAGMKAEDIILKVNGVDIDNGEKLIEVVASIRVGVTVPIEVFRDGKTVTLDVEIADREKLYPEQAEVRIDERESDEVAVRFGITVQEISPAQAEQMRLEDDSGVLITRVDAGSFAQDVGLRPRDVLVAVNRRSVSSIRSLREIQRTLEPGMDVAFKILRFEGQGWETRYLADVLPD